MHCWRSRRFVDTVPSLTSRLFRRTDGLAAIRRKPASSYAPTVVAGIVSAGVEAATRVLQAVELLTAWITPTIHVARQPRISVLINHADHFQRVQAANSY